METTKDNITFLLKYCSECPEIYNEVANNLWSRFHIVSAEIVLLITYYVAEERKYNHDVMLNRLNSTYGLYADTDSIKKVMPEWMRRIDNGKDSTSNL